MIYSYNGREPRIDAAAFIADYTAISGDVEIQAGATVWFGAVIRGDVAPVRIGRGTNVQDLSCLHESPGMPLVLGEGVTVGHRALLHSCTIEDGALIGMGAIVLDGARIGKGAFVGAGSLVTPGTEIPPGMLAFGSPARLIRPLRDEEIEDMARIRREYEEKGRAYRAEQQNLQGGA